MISRLTFMRLHLLHTALFFLLVLAAPSGSAAQDREKPHSFQFRSVELRVALDSLMQWYAVPLIYLDKDVEGKRIDAECSECDFEDALRHAPGNQGE